MTAQSHSAGSLAPGPEADLAGLIEAARAAAAAALGRGVPRSSVALIAPCPGVPDCALLCTDRTLSTRRGFRIAPLRGPLAELLPGSRGAQAAPEGLEGLTGPGAGLEESVGIEPGPKVLVHGGEGAAKCVFMIDPGNEAPAAGTATLEALDEAVGPILMGAEAPARLAALRREVEELRLIHETMLEALVAADKPALLSELAEVLGGHFGFGRFFICLLQRPAEIFRSELHSGFDPSFIPFTIPLERKESFLVQAVEEGEIVYFDRRGRRVAELARYAGGEPIRRAVVAPLKIGSRPLGFIYADRPRREDVFVFRSSFDTFVQLASVAVENLGRRVSAERRAETDALTGCYNRFFLDRVLEVEVPRVKRYDSSISLLMLDLCDFKRTNDVYGHLFGDHILRETVSLIQANVREPDIVIRYGGDEFVVLMVNTNQEQARRVQQRIEQAFIERNRTQDDERMAIDISIGLCTADGRTITSLLENADRSMYAHKTERRKTQLVQALMALPSAKPDAIDSVVTSLLANLNKKEPFNSEHSRRVAYLCLVIVRELGLGVSEVHDLLLGALLHDVGKASLPGELLSRAGPLTPGERKAIETHPMMGEEYFAGIAHLESIRPIVRHHHERFDGATSGEFAGYPYGLAGERIPQSARVLKLADSTDAMLMGRPYRAARTPEEVVQVLRREARASFDPTLVQILLSDKGWSDRIGSAEALAELYREVIFQAEQSEKRPAPPSKIEQPA